MRIKRALLTSIPVRGHQRRYRAEKPSVGDGDRPNIQGKKNTRMVA